MKLHLPSPLRKALLAVIAAVAVQPVMAASMSTLISQAVYCDFGDNAGLYSVHGVNALLTQLRKEEKGIYIYYTDESLKPQSVVEYEDQPMISFESRMDSGPGAAVSYNILATVEHNGVLNPTFTATKIGGENAIRYYGIEYRKSAAVAQDASFEEMNVFRLVPQTDFKITRLSKIVTDVSTYDFNTAPASAYTGEMWYRSGSGSMYRVDAEGGRQRWGGAYSYNTGGIMEITLADNYANYGQVKDYREVTDTSGSVKVNATWWTVSSIAGGNQPLPFCIQSGDSGSPTWIYDPESKTYLYSGAMQSGEGSRFSQARYAGQWAKDTEEYFNVNIGLEDGETIHIGEVNIKGTEHYDAINNVTSHPYEGIITRGDGSKQNFIGVKTGISTWNSLSGLKDSERWYSYDNSYLNSSELTYADLFETENLVFTGKDGGSATVVLDATVDTGIGYARFCKEDGSGTTDFTLKAGNSARQLDTAGLVVEKGVNLHVQLTGDSSYMREWRKAGDGNLYVEGEGRNDVLLNLGGSGTTYLQRNGGYAAYNVLANNGTHVVIGSAGQINRDFTFGYGGAWLDMNGTSMELFKSADAIGKEGFSIHALTDEAVITNCSGIDVTLTWKDTEWVDNQASFLGSFQDEEGKGSLRFVYAAESGKKLTLNSISTKLANPGSGITVQGGTLVLQGTVTQHAPGSLGVAFSSARLVNNDDWHYADMTTPVTVQNGGTFELGNHARLIGDVTVEAGGTFVMREGVTHQYEYLEGGYVAKDTDTYKAFFGLKGDVDLREGGTLFIEFTGNADSVLEYGHAVKGSGTLSVAPGIIGGEVKLSGDNSLHTGQKKLEQGGLVIARRESLGNTGENKWLISNSGFMVLNDVFSEMSKDEILGCIDSQSTGGLALTHDSGAFDLQNHRGLYIGAYKDCTVQYGTAGTDETLDPQNGEWRLGGGGGELVVNYKLTGTNNLVLGDKYSNGTVRLTNTQNDFDGNIMFKGGVTLAYDTDAVLGKASFSITYTNRVAPGGGLGKILAESDGVLLLDKMVSPVGDRKALVNDLDLTGHTSLYIGSSEDVDVIGKVRVAQDKDFLFGGSTAVMSIKAALEANGTNGLVVDGQTYSGGEIRLEKATNITGNVLVRGCDKEKLPAYREEGGGITLGLRTNDAISSAAKVTLQKGGCLDLHGSNQRLNNLQIDKGGAVLDSTGSGTLNLYLTQGVSWNGDVEARTINVNGQGRTLSMGGSASYAVMNIKANTTVNLAADYSLSAFGITNIESGANLNMGGHSVEGNIVVHAGGSLTSNVRNSSISGYVTLDNGTIHFSQKGTMNGDSTLISNGGTIQGNNFAINGNAVFQQGTTYMKDSGGEGGIDIGGTVEMGNSAVLRLVDNEYSIPFMESIWTRFNLTGSEFNTASRWDDKGEVIPNTGKLVVETRDLRLGSADQNFGGIVELVNGKTAETKVAADKGVKTFDNLWVNTTKALLYKTNDRKETLATEADWVIHHLSGTGSLTAKMEAGHYVCLDDTSSYGQTLTMQGGTLVLAAEDALQNGAAKLTARASLAVKAAVARVRGLEGESGTTLYAGTEISSVSSQNGTLVVHTDGAAYTYAGSVQYNKEQGCGISILKEGEGTQAFSGSSVTLRHATVQEGSLDFSQATAPAIKGNVSIAQGADLKMGSNSLGLESGQVLSVIGGTAGASAALAGKLAFNGGSMQFSGQSLAAELVALLDLQGTVSATGSVNVDITDENLLATEHAYSLSTGNWTGIVDSMGSDSLIYHRAEFSATDTLLSVTLHDRTDIQVWDGTELQNNWNATDFGSEPSKLNAESTAIFNDAAESSTVSVDNSVAVKEMVFDNDSKDYTLQATENAGVQAGNLRQVGDGNTTLGNGVSAETASVESGTLSLAEGSAVQSVSVAESAVVELLDNSCQPESISGEGIIRVNWGNDNTQSLNFSSIGTVEVESGTVDMRDNAEARMNVLHVKDGTLFTIASRADNYADKAIVDAGGRLETTIFGTVASGTVGSLEGAGTVALANDSRLDLGDNRVSGGSVDATAFTGTLELGNGKQQMRFRSSNVTGLGSGATIDVADKAQYWVTDNGGVVDANLVLHGNSGAAKGNSWNGEGFGAVRDASAFNGDITIDGNASVSGHNGRRNVVFNGKLQGYGESGQDTLTMACYYAANTMTYTFSSAADASGLDSFVLRRSGNDTNGNGSVANIEGAKGLAKSVEFYAGTADSAVLNIKADASAERLKSAAGDGVVNIGEGKSLELTKGADYGGQINLGAAVAASTADAAEGAVARVSGDVRFSMADATHASIAGAANGSTRVENMAIDLAAGTRLEMENITLSATSSITDAEATLVANSLVVEAQVGGNLKPLTYGDASPAPEARETGEVVSFTLSNIQDVAIEGTGLMVRLVGDSATALGGAEWLELGLGTDAVFTDSLAVTLLFTGADGQAMAVQGVYTLPTAEAVALAAEAEQQHNHVYFHLAGAAGVPEPSSATLSLLALAALAARRRRKG